MLRQAFHPGGRRWCHSNLLHAMETKEKCWPCGPVTPSAETKPRYCITWWTKFNSVHCFHSFLRGQHKICPTKTQCDSLQLYVQLVVWIPLLSLHQHFLEWPPGRDVRSRNLRHHIPGNACNTRESRYISWNQIEGYDASFLHLSIFTQFGVFLLYVQFSLSIV